MSYNPDICWRQLGAALRHLVDLATDKEEAKREAAALVIVAGQAAEGETARGVAAERVRIRRELLTEVGTWIGNPSALKQLEATIRRICGEED